MDVGSQTLVKKNRANGGGGEEDAADDRNEIHKEDRGAQAEDFGAIASGQGALLVPSSMTSLQRVRKLLDKYAALPMDFAAATLVALAEELDSTSVFTTDRTDFSVYRVGGRKPFRIVPSD